jgi:hypothetical protein
MVVQDVAIKRETALSNSREIVPVGDVGHDRQTEKNQAQSHELVVQQKALVSGIDKQLSKLASINTAQKSTNSLADASQRSAEWASSESSKFSSSATTVLFPEDLKNIRKIIKEELASAGGSGGFSLPGMLPNKGGTPKPTPGTPTPGAPTPGAPTPGTPTPGKAIQLGSKFLKGSLVGAAFGGGMALYDSITESKQIEEQYRAGELSKEARDQKQKESNYRNGGKAIGSTLGAGLGALTGPLAFLAVPTLSYLGGIAGESAGDYFSKTPVASASEAMVSGGSVQMKDVNKKSTELSKDSKDAVDAITKVSEKFDIPKNEMLTAAMQESSLDSNAAPKTSAARGLFQFIPDTWNKLIKKNKDIATQYGIGEAIISGKDDRLDPLKSSVMYALLRRENIQILGKLTTGSRDVDLYILHLFGAGRGKAVIGAYINSPSDSIKKHIGADQYTANLEIVSRKGVALSVSEFVVNIAALLKRRGAEVRKKVEKMDEVDSGTKTGSEGSVDVRKGVDTQSSSNAAGGANTGSGSGVDKANGDKVVINSGVRSNKATNESSSGAGTGATGNIGKNNRVGGVGVESSTRPDLRKKLNDDRLSQTAAVNGDSGSGGSHIIINNQQSAPAQQSGMNSSPEKSASLSTRNNDSYYSAMKAIEMTRLS